MVPQAAQFHSAPGITSGNSSESVGTARWYRVVMLLGHAVFSPLSVWAVYHVSPERE